MERTDHNSTRTRAACRPLPRGEAARLLREIERYLAAVEASRRGPHAAMACGGGPAVSGHIEWRPPATHAGTRRLALFGSWQLTEDCSSPAALYVPCEGLSTMVMFFGEQVAGAPLILAGFGLRGSAESRLVRRAKAGR